MPNSTNPGVRVFLCVFYVKTFEKRDILFGWEWKFTLFRAALHLLQNHRAIWWSVGWPIGHLPHLHLSFHQQTSSPPKTFSVMRFAHGGSQWSLNYLQVLLLFTIRLQSWPEPPLSADHFTTTTRGIPLSPASCIKVWFFIPSHKIILWSIIMRQGSNHLKRKRCNSRHGAHIHVSSTKAGKICRLNSEFRRRRIHLHTISDIVLFCSVN